MSSCKISYIDKSPISETEKARLSEIHKEVFIKAKESGAFRSFNDRLYSIKQKYAEALNFIAKTNEQNQAKIATLPKDQNGNFLSVNVLPLSTEQQGELFLAKLTENKTNLENEPTQTNLDRTYPRIQAEGIPRDFKLLRSESVGKDTFGGNSLLSDFFQSYISGSTYQEFGKRTFKEIYDSRNSMDRREVYKYAASRVIESIFGNEFNKKLTSKFKLGDLFFTVNRNAGPLFVNGDNKLVINLDLESGIIPHIIEGVDENKEQAFLDTAISEELIHLASKQLSTPEETSAAYSELSKEDKLNILQTYYHDTNEVNLSKMQPHQYVHEYVRMQIQKKVLGYTTEEKRTKLSKIIDKVWNYLKELINNYTSLKSIYDKTLNFIETGEGNLNNSNNIELGLANLKDENSQNSIINQLKQVSQTLTKKEDGYYIGDKKVKHRVTEISKTWYENRFADKDLTKSEYQKSVDDLKAEKGTAGHTDIEYMLKSHFLDENGRLLPVEQRPSDVNYTSQLNPNDKTMYSLLKENMEKRLASFPEGTVFLSEMMVYDPKRDLAGTIDFIAVEPSGKTNLLDWKFMDLNTNTYDDVPWYKVGAWREQMKTYKQILKRAYNIKFDGSEQTRMIPIKAHYSQGNYKTGDLPRLERIEIGNVEVKNEERAYLLPVGLEEERTGNKRIDNLLEKLNTIYDVISSKKVTDDKKVQKAEQLNALYKAIRQLKLREKVKPLVDQAKILNKEIQRIIDDYNTNWKNTNNQFSQKEKNEFADRILIYEDSLKVYTTLYNDLKGLFSSELTEEEQKLKDDLRDTTETANELENDLEEIRNEFAENVIAKSENVLEFLKPEKIIQGLSKWFGSTSTLQSKAVQVLYRMANRAFTHASMDTVDQGNKLKELKKNYDSWAKSRGLTHKNYFDILKKKDKNELIDEFNPEFFKELKSKTNDKNKQWIKDNIDVIEYAKFLKEEKKRQYESIERKTRAVDESEAANQIKFEKIKIDELYDISTIDSPGWLLRQYTAKFPKREKWETKEWKELHKAENKPALDFFNYIKERNEHYQKIGYIRNSRTFLPFVRKSLAEKIFMGGDIRLGEELLRNITISEGDVGYGEINPITKEPVYKIPKYFTRDTGDQISEDLFKNMTLLNEMAIRYEYLNDIEDSLRLIIRTESNKDAIKTSFFGKTKYKADGEVETIADNSENTKLLADMMEAIVYGHKYIESENFDQLLGGLGKLGKNLNDKLGKKIFTENYDDAQISLNKTINQINNFFQIKTLGLNPVSALSNFFGGSFQSYINAGAYFTKSEFAKNEFIMAARMNGVDAKKYIGALQYFLPLTENYNFILAKELSLSTLSGEKIQDFLMSLMRKSDQYVQTVNFFSYLDNTIVQDGKLVNAREYLRTTEKYENMFSAPNRKELDKDFEEDVKKLLDEKGVLKLAKVEKDQLVIPGIDRKSEDVVELRRKVQSLTKDALGNLSEDDLRKINLNIFGKSFMIFKNWIPRLVDVRFGNLKYNAGSDAYEWGRTRMMFRTLSENTLQSTSNLISAISGNDEKWVSQMKDLYEKKREEYFKDTGKELKMTESQFIELTKRNIKNQMTDFLFYLTLTAIFLSAKALGPDDDAEKYVKNQHKFMLRVMDKLRDEIAYFYNPTSIASLTTSGIFPSLSLLQNYQRLFTNFGKEMYAIGIGDEKLQDKNYVIKYSLKGLPIASQFDSILLMFYPDLAKDLGMRAQSESKPIGK